MKCSNCGAELKEGCIYCSVCGHEAQMVNGFSVIEDDYLRSILSEEVQKTENKSVGTTDEKKREKKVAPVQSKKKKNNKTPIIVVLCILILVIIAGIICKAYINHKNNNSYDYQISMAEKELTDKNYENALDYYKNALALHPEDIDARMEMADIYMLQKDDDAAMVLLMEVIGLDKNNVDAYKNLISIYDAKGEYTKIQQLSDGVTNAEILSAFSDYIVTNPVFYPDEGTYDTYITVTILSIEGYDIYYTLNGSNPTENGTLYTEDGIELERSGTYNIRAASVNEKGIYSDVVEKTYRVSAKAPAYPTVLPDGGNFTELTAVSIEVQEGCTAYYTWDGTTPTEASQAYSQPIEIPEGNNILSIVVVDDRSKLRSEIYRANFIYTPTPVVE